jgi:hypothetical protein
MNAVLWDAAPSGSCKNRRFGGTLVFPRSVLRFLVIATVPRSPIRVALTMVAIRSSETSVLTRATRLIIAEDGILDRPSFTPIPVPAAFYSLSEYTYAFVPSTLTILLMCWVNGRDDLWGRGTHLKRHFRRSSKCWDLSPSKDRSPSQNTTNQCTTSEPYARASAFSRKCSPTGRAGLRCW